MVVMLLLCLAQGGFILVVGSTEQKKQSTKPLLHPLGRVVLPA